MSAADRLTRLFALVPYLQNNQGIPVKEVAAEFGVSVREILKDVSTLWVTGIGDLPGELIDFDYDALEDEGLIYIKDAEFLPRPLRLSRNEGIALTIGLRTLRETADAAEHAVIDSALAKLEDAVGDASRAPVDIHVEKIDPAIMSTVRQALADAQAIAGDAKLTVAEVQITPEDSPLVRLLPRGDSAPQHALVAIKVQVRVTCSY